MPANFNIKLYTMSIHVLVFSGVRKMAPIQTKFGDHILVTNLSRRGMHLNGEILKQIG